MTFLRILASPYRETEKYNPVTSLLYGAMEGQGAEVGEFTTRRLISESWDVWHLHWPEQVLGFSEWLPWKLFRLWAKLKVARAKKLRIFWTAHNLHPHERRHPIVERLFWRIFLPNVDGIICMSKSGRELLHDVHPATRQIPVFVIPHGHYRGVYPDDLGKGRARDALGIGPEEAVMAFVGQIRAYKGVPLLIRSFSAAALPLSRLLIAGEPREDNLAREIHAAASSHPNVALHLDFVDAQDMQLYLRAADLIVLPYSDILNSGTALLALSFDRPVLVPDRGALGELAEAVGSNWVRLYDGDLTPQILRDAVAWLRGSRGDGESAPLESLGWDRIATQTLAAFAGR